MFLQLNNRKGGPDQTAPPQHHSNSGVITVSAVRKSNTTKGSSVRNSPAMSEHLEYAHTLAHPHALCRSPHPFSGTMRISLMSHSGVRTMAGGEWMGGSAGGGRAAASTVDHESLTQHNSMRLCACVVRATRASQPPIGSHNIRCCGSSHVMSDPREPRVHDATRWSASVSPGSGGCTTPSPGQPMATTRELYSCP